MCAYGRRTAASAARGAAAAVLLLPRLHGGKRGSATAVSAARGPAATALMRHQLCGGQWRLCRGQRWQPNCGSSGAVASSRRSAAAVAVREGLSAIAAARWDSATSTTIAEAVRASAGAGRLLQRLRGEISAASTTAAAAVRESAVAGPLLQRLRGGISAHRRSHSMLTSVVLSFATCFRPDVPRFTTYAAHRHSVRIKCSQVQA